MVISPNQVMVFGHSAPEYCRHGFTHQRSRLEACPPSSTLFDEPPRAAG
jgi:hypothetical protein